MEALKKVFSPGHDVDDELMYGSGDPKTVTQPPEKATAQGSNSASTGTGDAIAQPSGPTASDSSSYGRPQDSKIGHSDRQEPKPTSKAAETSIIDSSRHPASHPADAQSQDFATSNRGNSRIDSDLSASNVGDAKAIGQTSTSSSHQTHKGDDNTRALDHDYREPATHGQISTYTSHPSQTRDTTSRVVGDESSAPNAYGQGGTYSSLPAHTRDSVSPAIDREPSNPTTYGQTSTYSSYSPQTGDSSSLARDYQSSFPSTYGQPESMSAYTAGAGTAVGAAAAAGQSRHLNSDDKTYPQDESLSGVHAETTGPENQFGSRQGMPGEFPSVQSDNPYSSSHLDPRVDSHANTASAGSTSGFGTAVTPTTNPADPSRGYDRPRDSEGLSGAKTTAEPFESSHGPKGVAEPFAGSKGTSEPLRDEGRHQGKVGAVMGKIGLGGHGAKSRSDDRAQDSSLPPTTEDRAEPGQVSDPGVETSHETTHAEDSHKERKGGLLGALGLKGHGSQKHVDEEHEPSTAESRREPVATTGARTEPSHIADSGVGTSHEISHREESHKEQKGGLLGVLGLKKHGSKDHGDEEHEPSTTTGATPTHSTIATSPTTGPPKITPASTSTDKPDESHTGRNVAIGGAAAAGAGALGAHEYSRRQAEQEEQDRLAADAAHRKAVEDSRKAAEKEQKTHEKALAKEEKKAEKAHEKAVKKEEKKHEKEEKKVEKAHEKAILKEEKKAEKEHEKTIHAEEKKAEKEHEKAVKAEEKKEKEHEKEFAKQEKEAEKGRDSEESGKKKGGLLGLFKRRRDSKGNEIDDEEHDRTDAENAATAGTAGATGAGSYEAAKHPEHGRHHEMNKLHKDPPPEYGGGYTGDSATPAYADYAVKENDHPGAQTVTGGYTAPDPEHDANKYPGAAGAGPAGTGSMINRPRGGYGDEAYPVPAGGATAGSEPRHGVSGTTPEGQNIAIHSDGKRHYDDGSLVDPAQEQADDGTNKHKHDGSKVDKVLEKLYWKTPSEERTHTS